MSEEATLDEFVDSGSETSDEELMTSLDETSVGNIPSNWSAVRLGDLAENTLYGANESAEDYDPCKPRYIRIKDIDERGYLKESEKASLSEDKAEGYLLKKGDMLFSRSGSPGRTYLHRDDEGEYCYGGYSIKHELISEGLNHEYLSQYTKSEKYWDWIERIARTGAQANINSREYASLLVPLPLLPEQRKIATVLYTVDRAIEKTEELVNQTERVKAGLTQELLKNGINNQQVADTDSRFGLLPESWELQPLKSVGEVLGRTAPEKDDSECWGGEIPWATPSEITSLVGQTINDTDEHLTELALEKVSSNLIPPMSVLMTTRATIGECAVNTVEMTTNQGFKNVIPGQHLDTWYTYYRLDYERDYLASLSKGSTFPEVGKDTVENFVIPIPPIEEQREIGEVLRSVDDQILSYKQSKSQYQRLKRGLMQDLLSGTVRTTNTTIEVPDDIAQYG